MKTPTQQLLSQAAFSQDEMRQAESKAREYDVNRRFMLACLSRSRDELLASFRGDPTYEHLRAAFEMTEEYIQHLEDMLEASQAARTRLLAVAQVLAREHGVSAFV